MSKIAAIDPSINRVGWAVIEGVHFDEETLLWTAEEATWRWGYWDISSNLLSFKLKEIVEYMIITFDGMDPDEGDHLVLEWPQFFDIARGQIAAREGHTLNLAAIDAYIAGFFRLEWDHWHPVKPSEWKGNVSKEITLRRFFRELGIKRFYAEDHNAVDAVMMLLDFCKKKRITNRIVTHATQSLGPIDIEPTME